MVDGHGKIGGSVIQKGRSSSIARVKVKGTNPQSSYQQAIRSVFSYFSAKFRSLGPTVVAAWNAAASNGFTSTNVFGNSFKKTGHGLYVGLNMNLNLIEQAELTNPPSPAGISNPTQFDPTADVSATEMFLNATFQGGGTAVPSGTALVLIATPPVSGGVSFVKGQYRFITWLDATDDTATTNVWSDYAARFGAPVAANRIGLAVVAVNKVTGEAGIAFSQIISVAP